MVTEIKQKEENVWQESCAKNETAEFIKNGKLQLGKTTIRYIGIW